MKNVIDTQTAPEVATVNSTSENELLDILLQPDFEVEADEVEEIEQDPIQVGAVFTSTKPKLVYTRKGKQNLVKCNSVEITALNMTGRRITCVFRDSKNAIVLERRVYREWVEQIIEEFSK